jgi:TRAP-type mannitol/chloroaromatic compound transport system substrate-binding protein
MQWIYLGLGILAGFWGSFFGAYFKKKGENRAVREDIQRLTQMTKEIEAKISDALWNRQKQWELKRDVLFEGTKRIAALDEALTNYKTFIEVERANRQAHEPEWPQGLEKRKAWSKAVTDFDETRLLAGVICSRSLQDALDDLAVFTSQIVAELIKKDTEIYNKSHAELFKKILMARSAVRKELGFGPDVVSNALARTNSL